MSLVSSDSAASLPASLKRTNGSTLKQSTTVENGRDPEEVLAEILGSDVDGNETEESQPCFITEEDLDWDFDFGGLSLHGLANSEPETDAVALYRSQAVEDCG